MARTRDARRYERRVRTTVGRRLRSFRLREGLTQASLAAVLLNTTQASLSNYEQGLRTMPVDVAIQVCSVLGITFDELLGNI